MSRYLHTLPIRLCRQCVRHASSQTQDSNLLASKTASRSYPPPGSSLPRPLKSHASHRTSQPTKIRDYPDRIQTPRPPVDILPEAQSAPNLPYFVTRTKSNGLPVYLLSKRGGNLKQTRIKKIDGNVDDLRDAIQATLRVPQKECVVNRVNNHVVIKGWHKPRLEEFFEARRF